VTGELQRSFTRSGSLKQLSASFGVTSLSGLLAAHSTDTKSLESEIERHRLSARIRRFWWVVGGVRNRRGTRRLRVMFVNWWISTPPQVESTATLIRGYPNWYDYSLGVPE